MLLDGEHAARLEAGEDLREIGVLRVAAHPAVEHARGSTKSNLSAGSGAAFAPQFTRLTLP